VKPHSIAPALPVAFLAVIFFCGGVTLAFPRVAFAQEPLSVEGKVVNGTSGSTVPGDLAVLMLITGADGTLTGTGQTVAQPDGSFVFEDVTRVREGVYTLSVDYGGVFYGLSLASNDLDGEKIITLFEPTEDAQVIVIDRQVMVITGFDVSQRVATATEFVRFTNPTDRTLQPNLETARPGMFSFMRFALPPNATNVTVQSDLKGGEVISVGTGFALTAPVPPGQHSVDFAYTFPYEGGSIAYRNSLPQGAGIFQILVPDRWEDIGIGGISSRQPVGIQDEIYRAWEGRDILPGPGVDLEINGLPQPGVLARVGGTLSGSSFWLAAVPSAVAVVLLVLLVVGVARRYRPAFVQEALREAEMNDAGEVAASHRREIVAELAALDELHEQGGVQEYEYLRQRVTLVNRALRDTPGSDS
jgi:hypothetical protein